MEMFVHRIAFEIIMDGIAPHQVIHYHQPASLKRLISRVHAQGE
jgi:hypothetical protein